VSNWEFQPARVGSLALASEIEVPVRFELGQQAKFYTHRMFN
jgi:hypothetical protein